ncbi:MAG: hypothetical protein ACK5QJ_15200 [Microcystis sp.]|jgi:hypothetical protein|nr:hypothetical protein [Microcystis sp. LE17-20D]MCZ8067870.1 hypothetical protein [Microcystis sp. LE17-20D]MCZ8161291.1 hypothetical protein [Microcystis sp. LE19-196.1B]MCZ8273446.1 hypothetical protein [Microcystis sp. LE19-4.1E]
MSEVLPEMARDYFQNMVAPQAGRIALYWPYLLPMSSDQKD